MSFRKAYIFFGKMHFFYRYIPVSPWWVTRIWPYESQGHWLSKLSFVQHHRSLLGAGIKSDLSEELSFGCGNRCVGSHHEHRHITTMNEYSSKEHWTGLTDLLCTGHQPPLPHPWHILLISQTPGPQWLWTWLRTLLKSRAATVREGMCTKSRSPVSRVWSRDFVHFCFLVLWLLILHVTFFLFYAYPFVVGGIVSPQKMCLSPNPLYLWMWSHLEIEALWYAVCVLCVCVVCGCVCMSFLPIPITTTDPTFFHSAGRNWQKVYQFPVAAMTRTTKCMA